MTKAYTARSPVLDSNRAAVAVAAEIDCEPYHADSHVPIIDNLRHHAESQTNLASFPPMDVVRRVFRLAGVLRRRRRGTGLSGLGSE
jgi:hypothetical protein